MTNSKIAKKMVFRSGMTAYYHPYGIDAVAEYSEEGLLIGVTVGEPNHERYGEKITNLDTIENIPHAIGLTGGTSKVLGTLAPKSHIGFGDMNEQAQKMSLQEDTQRVFFPHKFLMCPTILNLQSDHVELLNLIGFRTLSFVTCNDATEQQGVFEYYNAAIGEFGLSKELSQFPGRVTTIIQSSTGKEQFLTSRIPYRLLRIQKLELEYKSNGQLLGKLITSTKDIVLTKSYSYILRNDLGINQMFIIDTLDNVVRTVSTPAESLKRECPLCGDKLTVGHGATICSNYNCTSQLYQRLDSFLSQLKIPFTSETIIGMTTKNKVKSLSDAVKLGQSTVINNFTPAWLKDYVRSFPENLEVSYLKLLWSLEIPGLTNSDINSIVDASRGSVKIFNDYLLNKPRAFHNAVGLSSAAHNAFVNWAITPESIAEWKTLSELMTITDAEKDKEEKPHTLVGVTVYLSGNFRYGKAEKVKALITEHGGVIHENVTEKTKVFVVGALMSGQIGSEMRKAKTLKIPMVSEERFFADNGVQL
jgi:hypothetical protein